MRISEKCIALVKHFESCFLQAYKCPAGVWTIGYGHTGKSVTEGLKITGEEAEIILKSDLDVRETAVSKLILVKLSQHQFDALVSFVFNVGIDAFRTSTLLRKLNLGNYIGAANELPRWCKTKGKVLPGLLRRRKSERHLFLNGELNYFQGGKTNDR